MPPLPQSEPQVSSPEADWRLLLLAGILVAGFIVVFLVEPWPIDPMIYLTGASDLGAVEANHWTTRIGLLLPVALTTGVFGVSEFGFYTMPVLYGAVFGAATAWLGWTVLGRPGLLAGIAGAASPIVLPFGSQLLPDVGAAGMVAASLVLVTRAGRAGRDSGVRWAVASGALMGLAYLVREISLVFFVPLFATAWLVGVRDRLRLAALAAGGAAVAVLEAIAGQLIWGDPFTRVRVLLTYGGDRVDPVSEAASGFWSSLKVLPDLLWATRSGSVVLVLVAVALAMAIWRRSRLLGVVLAWVGYTWVVYAVLGSIGVMRLLDRYWAVIIPVLVVAAFGGVVLVVRGMPTPIPTLAVGLATTALVVLGVFDSLDNRYDVFMRFEDDGYWQLRESFAEVPSGIELHVPHRVADVVQIYTVDPIGRPITDLEIVPDDPGAVADGGWLLVHEDAVRPVAGAAEAIVTQPDSHAVFDSDGDGPSWVLLSPSGGWASSTAIGIDADDWHGRLVDDGSWGPVEALSATAREIDGGDLLVAVNGPEWTTSPEPTTSPFVESDLVEIRVDLDVSGGRPLRIACSFHPEDGGGPVSIAAMTMVPFGPYRGEVIGYCLPPAGAGAWTVRPSLVFNGPTSVELGLGKIERHRP